MEIEEKYIKNVLEADDEHKRINALFDLKNEYLKLKKLGK